MKDGELEPHEERLLKRIISGNEYPREGDRQPVEITNGDLIALDQRSGSDPAMTLLIEQIRADLSRRDALVPTYDKARAAAGAAASREHSIRTEILTLDSRAAKTKEAFEVLKHR